MLLRRHRLIHNAVLLLFAAVAVLVLSVIVIAVAVTNRSGAAGTVALVLVLVGTVTLLGGLLLAARSIMISAKAIDYEVQRTLSLGSWSGRALGGVTELREPRSVPLCVCRVKQFPPRPDQARRRSGRIVMPSRPPLRCRAGGAGLAVARFPR